MTAHTERPSEFWERRYGGEARVWSGRVNHALAAVVADLVPGNALDLGCGEGGDVLWLASRGWAATGIDLSRVAVERARAAARDQDLPTARFIAADLGDWMRDPDSVDGADSGFDLITASFLQSPVELPREAILRAAAGRVAPGGRLVIVSHAAPPRWVGDAAPTGHGHGVGHGHGAGHGPGDFPTPEEEIATLDLDAGEWEVLTAEVRQREAAAPDGGIAVLDDTVIVVRRRNDS